MAHATVSVSDRGRSLISKFALSWTSISADFCYLCVLFTQHFSFHFFHCYLSFSVSQINWKLLAQSALKQRSFQPSATSVSRFPLSHFSPILANAAAWAKRHAFCKRRNSLCPQITNQRCNFESTPDDTEHRRLFLFIVSHCFRYFLDFSFFTDRISTGGNCNRFRPFVRPSVR